MQGRRFSVAAVVVVLGALVFAGGAQACSCAPQGPVEALRRADAAIVAHLVKVLPRRNLRADYRYRVQRVYRGDGTLGRGETISVRSARHTSACGLPHRQERPVGLFLLRDPHGRWTAGICSMITPKRLGHAAQRGGRKSRPPARASCTS